MPVPSRRGNPDTIAASAPRYGASLMAVLRVKNWASFQHYRDRSPPWIKLHKGLLNDFDYARLPLASRALAPCIWILASESAEGDIPADFDYLAFRLHCTVAEVENAVKPMITSGFLIDASNMLASCKQPARVEVEGELEREVETETTLRVVGEIPSHPEPEAKVKRNSVPCAEIVAMYHDRLPAHPRIEKLTPARRGHLHQRWREDLPTLEAWANFFEDVKQSRFLTGKVPGREGKPPFIADLEWLTRPGNFAKIAEGKYHR